MRNSITYSRAHNWQNRANAAVRYSTRAIAVGVQITESYLHAGVADPAGQREGGHHGRVGHHAHQPQRRRRACIAVVVKTRREKDT